ncbi:hypothetical protein ACSVH2_05890 [Flavobacterium sp. RSB2_4_14]|uniref:hypothetical protein n=1 Tax=Flavobacterium sp. RSB2_4_14 TaxID=3447665 RepID=UPI003F35510F
MQKLANFIKSFTDFVDKHGIVFHSLSLVFWVWILNLNINNPDRDKLLGLKISFYITIVFIVLSIFNLIMSVIKKFKKS